MFRTAVSTIKVGRHSCSVLYFVLDFNQIWRVSIDRFSWKFTISYSTKISPVEIDLIDIDVQTNRQE